MWSSGRSVASWRTAIHASEDRRREAAGSAGMVVESELDRLTSESSGNAGRSATSTDSPPAPCQESAYFPDVFPRLVAVQPFVFFGATIVLFLIVKLSLSG
jgi:hypothetical protein